MSLHGCPRTPGGGHVTFKHTGTYRDSSSQLGTYSQQGQHGPIICTVFLNDEEYLFSGFLTRITETRQLQGQGVDPLPTWDLPHGWLGLEHVTRPFVPPGGCADCDCDC